MLFLYPGRINDSASTVCNIVCTSTRPASRPPLPSPHETIIIFVSSCAASLSPIPLKTIAPSSSTANPTLFSKHRVSILAIINLYPFVCVPSPVFDHVRCGSGSYCIPYSTSIPGPSTSIAIYFEARDAGTVGERVDEETRQGICWVLRAMPAGSMVRCVGGLQSSLSLHSSPASESVSRPMSGSLVSSPRLLEATISYSLRRTTGGGYSHRFYTPIRNPFYGNKRPCKQNL